MAIHQTKKQSDLEKRLRLLRQQVYGRSSEHSENSDSRNNQRARGSENLNLRYSDTPTPSDTPKPAVLTQSGYLSFRSDITYLRHDLLKISILASFALAAQFILFYLLKNNILNFNFF